MEQSLFIGLIQNIAILLSFSLLYELVWWSEKRYHKLLFRILAGLIIGGIGILLIITPWLSISTSTFDTRTVLLLNTGIFFGPVATIVAMLVLVIFRISIAGTGLLMGVLTIITSGTVGLLWRRKNIDRRNKRINLELYFVALVVHVIMMLCTLVLPKDQIIPTVKTIIVPVILIYPLVSLLLGRVLLRRLNTWKSNEAIALAEERLKRFINSNKDQMFIKDEQFRYIVVNEALLKFFGKTKEEVINRTDYELMEKPYADVCRTSDQNALSAQGNYHAEERIGNRIFKVTKFPINIGRNKTGIGSIIKEITDSVKNRELQRGLLEISQLPYENITLRDYLFDIHRQLSRVIKCDNIYIALFHSENNTYSFPYFIDEYDKFESNDRIRLDNSLTDYIRLRGKGALIRDKDEKEIKKSFDLVVHGKHPSVWMGAPLMGGAGKGVIGVIAVQDYHDEFAYIEEDLITLELFTNRVGVFIERASYIKELKEAKEIAEKNDRLKTAFLANISHEIRTPMNAIIGFTDILIEELKDKDHLNYVSIINNSAYRLLGTVNDVIDIAKIEAGEVSVNIEKFDVYQVLRTLYNLFAHHSGCITLNISTPEGETGSIMEEDSTLFFEISTDRTKFIQIFTNLISNAIKFTEKGVVEFGFYKEEKGEQNGGNRDNREGNCDNRDPGIIYFVRDTGRGIAPDEIDYVFKRFYQTEHSKTGYHEGTGLGLTIVKEYLNLMGGDIWVKSHPGTGSTFFFTL